jgi:hypothetical protein
LPYRNPGDDVREWHRTQGGAMLVVQAGQVLQPQTSSVVDVGLPWGPKPRLILAHLNAEALRLGSPEIEIDDSLSAFVKRIRGFDDGREIRMFKEQLTRLSNALIRLAMLHGDASPRSIPMWSPVLSCGSRKTSASVFCGPQLSVFPVNILKVCKGTPSLSMKPT